MSVRTFFVANVNSAAAAGMSILQTLGKEVLLEPPPGTEAQTLQVPHRLQLQCPTSSQSVTDDLNNEKPYWPLSSYGPAKYEPTVVTGQDMSMEELRVKAAQAQAAGNFNEYAEYERHIIGTTEVLYNNIRSNLPQFFEIAKNTSKTKTPIDPAGFANKSAFAAPTISAFGAASTSSAFGTPSAFGASTSTPSAFGTTSAFGAPTQPVTSAFGAPAPASASAFGKPSTAAPSAFGQPAFGQPAFGQSAFGQTSATPAATTTTTSAFGQPAFGQSAFGQPAAPTAATTSAFGQPAFGQPSSLIKPATGAFSAFAGNTSSPFAAAAAAANTNPTVSGLGSTASGGGFSAFGNTQPTTFGSALDKAGNAAPANTGSVFGQPAFGQPAPAASASAFGGGAGTTTSAFGAPQGTTTSVFGQPSQPTSAFGQPAALAQSAFGQPAFGQPTPASEQPQQQQASAFSAFSAPQAAPSTSPFASAPSSTSMSSVTNKKAEPDFANAVYNYRPNLIPHDSKLPPNYVELLPKETLAAFQAMRFEWGKVPKWVPPVEARVRKVGEALFS